MFLYQEAVRAKIIATGQTVRFLMHPNPQPHTSNVQVPIDEASEKPLVSAPPSSALDTSTSSAGAFARSLLLSPLHQAQSPTLLIVLQLQSVSY